MEEAVIISAVRAPVGRSAGILKDVRPEDLAAPVIAKAVQCANIDPGSIENVSFGAPNQSGEDILEGVYVGCRPGLMPERSQ